MSFRNWPETEREASQAQAMSKDRGGSGLKQRLTLRLLKLQYNGARAYFRKRPNEVAVCWNGLNGTRRVFMQGAKAAGAKTLFFELGPFPGRITVDPQGVNNASCLPRDIAPYKRWFGGAQKHDWREIKGQIKQRNALRVAEDLDAPPLSDPFIFVALQTPGDSQLRLFGGNFPTVPMLIDAVAQAAQSLPEGWHIRIKEHPTAPESFAAQIQNALPGKVFLDNANDTFSQVAASRGVVTVNSSVGLEAMFYDKPVVACGECYWAIDGVAQQAKDTATLKALFAAPEQFSYSKEARDAFMSFLDQCYYPKMDRDDQFSLIAERLNSDGNRDIWQAP
ncbi:capsular biosynthesis protein [Shimia sp. R10_1]|uniref:capsular polysaccharide export protein, LipB/KpsS family n=1 Tax=Shimia sp. R10_1 TaxID=2821095 RepID=UPI001ADA9554|nr:capsular biosynthesis protein [Shimia sp. R10_1]MBO9472167.1 capsular biosynthesis protein [Shimia sp. R10_1]